MNDGDRVETAPQPQGQRLTLRRMRMALVWQLCSALVLSGWGLYLLSDGSKIDGTACCLGAVIPVVLLLTIWKQYRLVKSGAIVTVQSQASSQIFRIQPTIAIVAISLLTLVVLIMGAATLYILPSLSRMVSFQDFLVGLSLLLWLLTSFSWYRIATEQRNITVVEPSYEQGEGVWPPAPQVPKIK